MAGANKVYNNEEKAEALATLDANGGNISATSRQLRIDKNTLKRWRDQRKNKRLPFTESSITSVKEKLEDRLESLAHRIVDALPAKLATANAQQLGIVLGITIDKLRLLRGEATDIHEVRESDAKRELAERLARYTKRSGEEHSKPN